MVEHLSDLRLFREICRTLNFRHAGEKMGYSPAVVSMRVKRLETVTGKTLFLRSTRNIALTEEGRDLLVLVEKTLDLAELMATPKHSEIDLSELKGSVRITAPHSFARVFLVSALTEIHNKLPNVAIEILLDDSITQMIQEGIDISFRVGGNIPPAVESIDLLTDNRILIASKDYLKQQGIPNQPNDLLKHRCLSYLGLKQWSLVKNNKIDKVTLQKPLFCNTGDYLSRLVLNHMGITAKSEWSVHEQLLAGELVRVLPEYTLGEADKIRALLPKRDITPVRVRKVLEILQNHIAIISENIGTERCF